MKAAPLIVSCLCLLSSACATVDMTSLAKTSDGAVVTSVVEKNVVQRAANKLYSAFTNNGWTQKTSKKRVQSTASVLLKGLEAQAQGSDSRSYTANVMSVSQLLADVEKAQDYVLQVSKAAEVYLAMSGQGTNLLPELSSLEKALITARQAQNSFEYGFEKLNLTADTILSQYVESVDQLRNVTNQYGDHIRTVPVKSATLSNRSSS